MTGSNRLGPGRALALPALPSPLTGGAVAIVRGGVPDAGDGDAALVPCSLAACQCYLVESATDSPDELIGDRVPRFMGDLENAVDMLSGKVIRHGCQPVILIKRGLLTFFKRVSSNDLE